MLQIHLESVTQLLTYLMPTFVQSSCRSEICVHQELTNYIPRFTGDSLMYNKMYNKKSVGILDGISWPSNRLHAHNWWLLRKEFRSLCNVPVKSGEKVSVLHSLLVWAFTCSFEKKMKTAFASKPKKIFSTHSCISEGAKCFICCAWGISLAVKIPSIIHF